MLPYSLKFRLQLFQGLSKDRAQLALEWLYACLNIWGAFYNTPLESHLNRLGIDTLVFVGCNFPNCPRTSIYEASERDFKIVLVEDAVSGLYQKGKEEMLNISVQVTNAEAIKKAIIA